MKERIVSAGILAFALAYLAGSISLKVGTLAQPGAGLFPALIASCLLVIAAFHAWRTFRAPEGQDGGHSWTQLAPAGIAAALIVYPIILKGVDFLLATFIVLFVLFRLLGFGTIRASFLTALLSTLVSFVVFAGLLGVVVPAGFVEEFLLKIMEPG